MESLTPCPSYKSIYTCEMDGKLICPECGFEWKGSKEVATVAE
jgi:uncharacterized Zn ribbon protein